MQFGWLDGESGRQLPAQEIGLGIDIQSGQYECRRVAEAADAIERDLQSRRGRLADHSADAHPVWSVVAERDGVEPGGRVRIGVAGSGDFVKQLCGDRADADLPAGARVFGDHRRTVVEDLGQRKAGVAEVRDLSEEGIVAAGGLGSAFDDMSCHHGAGQAVVVVAGPAEVCGGRPDHD